MSDDSPTRATNQAIFDAVMSLTGQVGELRGEVQSLRRDWTAGTAELRDVSTRLQAVERRQFSDAQFHRLRTMADQDAAHAATVAGVPREIFAGLVYAVATIAAFVVLHHAGIG